MKVFQFSDKCLCVRLVWKTVESESCIFYRGLEEVHIKCFEGSEESLEFPPDPSAIERERFI